MGIVDILVGIKVCSQWDNEIDKIRCAPTDRTYGNRC
jgi:hypothetical protein